MKNNILKLLSIVTIAMLTFSFLSCSDDDDDGMGRGKSASSLVGRSFMYSYSGVDGDGNPEQWSTTLTFIDATQCSVNDKGYDYIWNNGYKKDSWNWTESCRYSVSGDKITLHNYPGFADKNDFVLTYKGNYLEGSGYYFYEK